MRILIVDDDAVVAQSCRRILEAEGLDVDVAGSVDAGEKLLTASHFDLMLTDIKMPGRDGFAMISHAGKIRPDMPVLVMTGYLTPETIDQVRRCGADSYIAKPFTPDELFEAVRRIPKSLTGEKKP